MTFHRIKSPYFHVYQIGTCNLQKETCMRDLGIIFEPSLCFRKHIDLVVAKGNMLLGLVTRTCKNFENLFAIKTLYTSLIRSVLEYGVIVWNSTQHNSHDKNRKRTKRIHKILFS